jgi:predicted AAA+ superfamily ATPase
MWIEREITVELRQLAASFPVVVLIGPRQVGKTSVLERTFPEYAYVSLDVAANAEMAETRPDDFIRRFPPPVVIDEIQYAPAFFRWIKVHVDAHQRSYGQFILSGSQNFMLMEAVADSLAGRAAVLSMNSLSFREWQPVWGERSDWHDFVWRGGFPRLWDDFEHPVSRDRWYQGYMVTYLERDVRNILNVGSLRDLERFLRACAARCSQTLNMSEIGRDVGISATTARQWISVLAACNLIFLLKPYYRSLGKRLAKSPKLYFADSGLAAWLMGFQSPDSIWASPFAGALWENHVIGQWLRWRDWQHPTASLWYWRDQAGNEVDLIIELDGRLHGIECKLTERPGKKDGRGLTKLASFYGLEMIATLSVACTTPSPHDIVPGITARDGRTVWEFG